MLDVPDDGRLLVIRRGGATPSVEVKLADNWLLSDLGEHGERIIYKIVGSPFANELADRHAGIDTVVITESDHMTFLVRLENEHPCWVADAAKLNMAPS